MMSSPVAPDGLTRLVRGRSAEPDAGDGSPGVDGDAWLRRLPSLVADAFARWGLVPDGPPWHGVCALVLPVRRDGTPAALKVTWPHPEARYEHLALRHWAGRGAVRLLAADPASWTLLLERLDGDRDLGGEPVEEACATIGDLLRGLSAPGIPALTTLSSHAVRWHEELAGAPAAVPRRFVEQARSLLQDFASEPGPPVRLLHTDLHFANVLAGRRGSWVAIDPKPMNGDPAYEVAPALWNRWDEALGSRDVRGHLRRRLDILCEHAGIDPDRARAWTLVREVVNAVDAVGEGDRPRVTTAIAVIKAMSG